MKTPASTYRVQFHAGFRFEDARRIIGYLDSLGITDLYASPLLAARAGSAHGYDVVDPTRLNPELGSRRDFDRLVRELRRHEMGLVLDVVPNHMAMSSENPWWMDVLANGRASRYAGFFDIDWDAPAMGGKILVPILGASYAEVLERGELTLELDDEHGPVVRYAEHRLPLDPKTWGRILGDSFKAFRDQQGGADPAVRLGALLGSVERLPSRADPRVAEIERRQRGVRSVRKRLRALLEGFPETRRHLAGRLRTWEGEEHVDRLDALIAEQPWLLANWRAAPEEIDYRRFFDIADLVALRSQDDDVFHATHDLVIRLVRGGAVTGLRVDHVDGLWDPLGYLVRLRDATGGAYVLVEKILTRDESLPDGWPVSGTTGYEFANACNDLFVDGGGWQRIGEAWTAVTGVDRPFEDVVFETKRAVIEQLFASEVSALTARLQHLARGDRYGRDLTRGELADAFVAVSAALRVYRTYVRDIEFSDGDRRHIERAIAEAERRSPPERAAAIAFLGRVLTLDLPSRGRARAWLGFVMRWQQFTGPVMAKGFEDTVLYIWNPLVSRNEPGSDPGSPPITVDDFHRRSRTQEPSHGLNATSTHDTKRSEDARTRIDALSERPAEWRRRVDRWREMNTSRLRRISEVSVPDAGEEWLLYETLVGVWPLDRRDERDAARRVREHMTKALREAKVHSSWIDPDERYERRVDAFVRSILARSNTAFLEELRQAAREAAFSGALSSLAQAVVKVGSRGVPDLYQGSERWNLRLVDPDNRADVDFDAAAASLRTIDQRARAVGERAAAGELLARWEDGRIKQWVLSRALRCRRANADLFADGAYLGARARGARADHVVAFVRHHDGAWAVALVPRLLASRCPVGTMPLGKAVWTNTVFELPSGAPDEWTDALTGGVVRAGSNGSIAVGDVLDVLPVALLVSAAP